MASISYLWQNRAKFPFASNLFFRAWVKRMLSLPELLKRNRMRKKLVKKEAVINSSAEIGNAVIEGKAKNLTVGAFSFIGRATIALHDEVRIGDKVCINDGVKILTASHDISDPLWRHIKKAIIIEDYVWIATNAIILPGVRIGSGAVIGAGAVVSKDVSEGEIVVGNPGIAIV